LKQIISSLHHEFFVNYLGSLHHFLGIVVSRTSTSLFLSPRQYILDLLSRAGMTDSQPTRTPADVASKLSGDGDSLSDPTLYLGLTGALQYANFTRPDIHILFDKLVFTYMIRALLILLMSNTFFVISKALLTIAYLSNLPLLQA
jgi:hypothetical protein